MRLGGSEEIEVGGASGLYWNELRHMENEMVVVRRQSGN